MAGQQAEFHFSPEPADREKSRINPSLAQIWPEAVWPAADLRVKETAIERSAFAYASILRVASVVGSLDPLVVKRGTREPAKGVGAEHVAQVLGDVNPENTYQDWMESKIVYLSLTGENLDEKVRGGRMNPRTAKVRKRRVEELHTHNPDDIRPVPGRIRRIDAYEIHIGANVHVLPWEDAIYTKYVHPRNPYRGLSPVAPMENDIAADIAAGLHNLRLIQNGVRTGGIFTPKEGVEWTPEHTAQFQAQIRNTNAGPNNSGRFLFVPQSGTFTPDGQSYRDMDYPSLRRLAREIIAGVIGAPPILIGNFESASYANSEAQLTSFWQHMGLPLLKKLFGALNEHWVHKEIDSEISIAPDLEAIEAMLESPGARAERGSKLFLSGVATQNEARAMAQLPPTPNGDVFFFPVNGLPISAAARPEIELDQPDPNMGGDPQLELDKVASIEESKSFAIKARAPISFEERQVAVASHESLLQGSERILKAAADMALFRQVKRIGHRLKQAGTVISPDEMFPTALEALHLYRDLQPALAQVVKRGGESALKRLGREHRGCGAYAIKADAPDPFGSGDEVFVLFDLSNQTVAEFIEHSFGQHIQKINDYTRRRLEVEFDLSRRMGEGVGGLFQRIQNMPAFSQHRAAVIARTETTAANNVGAHEGFRAAGVPLKSWLSSRDGDRVRHSHRAADRDTHAQPIGMSEKFILTDPKRGQTEARFPGDPIAAAWATVQCRCALQPEDQDQRSYWMRSAVN